MRRAGKTLIVTAVVAASGVAGTVLAHAGGWTLSNGHATLIAPVAKMPRGVEPSVAKQGARAVVSWSAQEIVPGVHMDHYVVTAHSADASPRPDVTQTVAADGDASKSIVFPAAQVTDGQWFWTVTPKYRDWVGRKSPKSRRLTFLTARVEEAPVEAVASTPTPAATPVPDRTTPPVPPAPGTEPSPRATGTEDTRADVPAAPSTAPAAPATPATAPAAAPAEPTGIPE